MFYRFICNYEYFRNAMHGIVAPSIDMIFERGREGSLAYTDRALLYQDMMAFSFQASSARKDSFSIWDLAGWLLETNEEFKGYYSDSRISASHTNKSNRTENIQKRIRRNFDNLLHVKLVEHAGERKQSKGTGTIQIYKFTHSGLLLASILETVSSQKKDKALKKAYDILMSIFTLSPNSPVATIFYHNFFVKCKKEMVFNKFVVHILAVANSGKGFNSVSELLVSAMDLGLKESIDRKRFLDLWLRTLEQLSPYDKKLLLFQMKLNAENRYRSRLQAGYSREYEGKWFELRNDYERIVIEGKCHRCEKEYVLVWPYISYRQEYANVESGSPIITDCPTCGNNDCLVIPSF